MLGRGQRAIGDYVGYFLTVQHPLQIQKVKDQVYSRKHVDFKEGGTILIWLEDFISTFNDEDLKTKILCDVEGYDWKSTFEDFKTKFIGNQIKGLKHMITKVNDTLAENRDRAKKTKRET